MYQINFDYDEAGVLTYYKYWDTVSGNTVCELKGNSLVWYKEPENDFVRAVVEEDFRKVTGDWFKRWFGVGNTKTVITDEDFAKWGRNMNDSEMW